MASEPSGLSTDDLQAIEEAYQQKSEDDLLLFVQGLTIPSAHGPRLFKGCIAPFQEEAFEALAPALYAVRNGEQPPVRRFWVERTKKAGKDSDLAACLVWLMAFPQRPILVQVVAANQHQAAIIKRRAADLLHYNPWLQQRVHIQQNRILNPQRMGEVVVEATDATGGAHGETPDLLILNELVHVARWSAMEDHMNNADGVPRGVVVVSTNAGIRGTKAELWRKNAIAEPERWKMLIWHQRSPWTSEADARDAKRRDPIGAEYARLWEGKWISGRGGAVDDAAIDRCFIADGPLKKPQAGWVYAGGLDLGVSHDHSGVVVIGANRNEQRLRVAWLKGWEPSVANDRGELEVDLQAVEDACFTLGRLFNIQWFGYDPAAGGSFMAQRLRKRGIAMREWSFSNPKNLDLMARSFVQSVKSGLLECWDDREGRLRRDFGKFSIVPKLPTGYKLEAVSDEYGHADVGTALVIALPKAIQYLGGFGRLQKEEELAGQDDFEPLTEQELDDMPGELREIYDVHDELNEEGRIAAVESEYDIGDPGGPGYNRRRFR